MNKQTFALAAVSFGVMAAFSACLRREAPVPQSSAQVVVAKPQRPALSDAAYSCELTTGALPARLAAGEKMTVKATLKNTSAETWPAAGSADGDVRTVNLASHWGRPGEKTWVLEGPRTPLPADLAPGQAVELEVQIGAPAQPGTYELGIDPVYESIAWFSWKSGCVKVASVTVK